jgi:tol-pal system protein YbgF
MPFETGDSMQTFKRFRHRVRNRFWAASLLAASLAFVPSPARAESKDMIELKAQLAQLTDMVQRLQSTVDSRLGVLQHLVEQTADNSNRVSTAMDDLQRKVAAQNEALSGKVDTSASQVQSVNDSIDEVKARLAKLEHSIQDLQTQLQNTPQPQPQPAPAGNAPGPASGPGGSASAAPPAPVAPPLQETWQAAVRDFNGARYALAQGEFQDIITYYPQDDMAGGAQYYLGEIAYKQKDYDSAVKAYNVVLESFPASSKAPAAQLHKGLALLAQNKRDAGIHELRSLIQRHPASPEAAQARSRLNGMSVRINPPSPTANN